MEEIKVKCSVCKWAGYSGDLLKAKNPFREDEEIFGCPKCLDINTYVRACDEFGCWKEAGCGTPTSTKYRFTCGDHRPKDERPQT